MTENKDIQNTDVMKQRIHDVLKKFRDKVDYIEVRAETTGKLAFAYSNSE